MENSYEQLKSEAYAELAQKIRIRDVDYANDVIICNLWVDKWGLTWSVPGSGRTKLQWEVELTEFMDDADSAKELLDKGRDYDQDRVCYALRRYLDEWEGWKLPTFYKHFMRIVRTIDAYLDLCEIFQYTFNMSVQIGMSQRDEFDEAFSKFAFEHEITDKYEEAKKVIRAGDSKVFNDWNSRTGVSMRDFIKGLEWLYEYPEPERDEKGNLVRELGVKENGTLVRMSAVYHDGHSLEAFYDADTKALVPDVYAHINYEDEI